MKTHKKRVIHRTRKVQHGRGLFNRFTKKKTKNRPTVNSGNLGLGNLGSGNLGSRNLGSRNLGSHNLRSGNLGLGNPITPTLRKSVIEGTFPYILSSMGKEKITINPLVLSEQIKGAMNIDDLIKLHKLVISTSNSELRNKALNNISQRIRNVRNSQGLYNTSQSVNQI